MKRITSNSVSEALMSAIEEADEIDQVLVLCRKKDALAKDGFYAFYQNSELTVESALWMAELFRDWLVSAGNSKKR